MFVFHVFPYEQVYWGKEDGAIARQAMLVPGGLTMSHAAHDLGTRPPNMSFSTMAWVPSADPRMPSGSAAPMGYARLMREKFDEEEIEAPYIYHTIVVDGNEAKVMICYVDQEVEVSSGANVTVVHAVWCSSSPC